MGFSCPVLRLPPPSTFLLCFPACNLTCTLHCGLYIFVIIKSLAPAEKQTSCQACSVCEGNGLALGFPLVRGQPSSRKGGGELTRLPAFPQQAPSPGPLGWGRLGPWEGSSSFSQAGGVTALAIPGEGGAPPTFSSFGPASGRKDVAGCPLCPAWPFLAFGFSFSILQTCKPSRVGWTQVGPHRAGVASPRILAPRSLPTAWLSLSPVAAGSSSPRVRSPRPLPCSKTGGTERGLGAGSSLAALPPSQVDLQAAGSSSRWAGQGRERPRQ